jgi:hypothetical protein
LFGLCILMSHENCLEVWKDLLNILSKLELQIPLKKIPSFIIYIYMFDPNASKQITTDKRPTRAYSSHLVHNSSSSHMFSYCSVWCYCLRSVNVTRTVFNFYLTIRGIVRNWRYYSFPSKATFVATAKTSIYKKIRDLQYVHILSSFISNSVINNAPMSFNNDAAQTEGAKN